MSSELWLLTLTAATLGFVHTILGPDHYVPFVMMARAGGWSRSKTLWVTFGCGLGHVLSSVLLASIGIALGVALARLEAIESVRGELAAWLLIGFGLAYTTWGLWQGLKKRPHRHLHTHADSTVHSHVHSHTEEHVHVHAHTAEAARLTPWILFTIFIFGPCEPLIPLLMYPAARSSVWGVVLVTLVFSTTTITTMLVTVLVARAGLLRIAFGTLEHYLHAFAGATIALCGLAIQFLGL